MVLGVRNPPFGLAFLVDNTSCEDLGTTFDSCPVRSILWDLKIVDNARFFPALYGGRSFRVRHERNPQERSVRGAEHVVSSTKAVVSW